VKRRAVARIDESRCIGCARCIAACPVDAIIGARGLMHTVAEPWCIGCRLCLPPCPVDCIDMIALPSGRQGWRREDAEGARRRARTRRLRLAQASAPARRSSPERQSVIARALERARRKRGAA